MSINKLKSVIRRGTMFGAAFAVVAATFAPASLTFADALNPLTDRSLTLSSSSPGWDFKDGSGNSTYAPANSGANGQKTGNTFAFKVSTDTATGSGDALKAMTFQYCTQSAGNCIAPGNITAHGPNNAAAIAAQQSDLEIVTSTPTEVPSGSFATYIDTATGAIKAVPTASNFAVFALTGAGVDTIPGTADDVWEQSTGWTMTAVEAQTGTSNGKPNQINLVHDNGTGTVAGTGFAAGTSVKVQFFATDTNYITNPGEGAFFVKINTFKAVNNTTPSAPVFNLVTDVIDGGVTVANVMNLSIQITTKVLETMEFSVGTVDPNTLSDAQLLVANGNADHSPCDRIVMGMDKNDPAKNVLKMGDADGEFSLLTTKTYSTHSYWRLSSNSSAGATVYYSGNTLSNTVGDKIKAIGADKKAPIKGSEQFGIALANGTGTDVATVGNVTTGYKVKYSTETQPGKVLEYGADDDAAALVALRADEASGPVTETGLDPGLLVDVGSNPSYHTPQLYPLIPFESTDVNGDPIVNYNEGAGSNNLAEYGTINTKYAFDETSQQIPVALATEDDQVVDCVTGKMRYIGNIAATTPAGIYTTKINYIAAPQY